MTVVPEAQPDHWLLRLSAPEWLAAARVELDASTAALSARQQRKGVANARRAAGMALNAVLVLRPDDAWGRSYMDHVRIVAGSPLIPDAVRQAAQALVDAPMDAPLLVGLGSGSVGSARAAAVVLAWCEREVGLLLAP